MFLQFDSFYITSNQIVYDIKFLLINYILDYKNLIITPKKI